MRYSSPWALVDVSLANDSRSGPAANAYTPALISLRASVASSASRCSTTARTRPSPTRTTRPYPVGSGTTADSNVAAAARPWCSANIAARVADVSNGASPGITTTVASGERSASVVAATRTA